MEVSGKKKDTDTTHSKSASAHVYCEPCDKDGLRLTAHGYCQDCKEHLCETCYKTHRKPAPCRYHVLLDKTQMPMSQSSDHHQVPHDLTKQCQLHQGKLIEYICHDHNILGCSPCITINHRNCKIDYIPDVSNNYQKSDEYRLFLRSLADLQKQFQAVIEETKANKKKILENKSLVQDQIKKFRQEINNLVDNLETNILKEADDISTKESARMESLSSLSIKLEKEIAEHRKDINELETTKKVNALYIYTKENNDVVPKLISAEKQACEDNYVNNFLFQPNSNLKEILTSKSGIGGLQRSESVYPNKSLNAGGCSFETLTAKLCGEINVKVPSDENDCCIPGAVLISKDTVAVVDSLNQAVKVIDTKLNKVTTEKRFSSRPQRLEKLPNDVIAVTFTRDKTIVFLSISDGLTEVRRLFVDGQCKDLAYSNNKLIVTFEWPGKIQIMNMDGKVNQSVQKDAYGNELKCPYVASGVKNTMCFSDYSNHTVTSMNFDGKVLKSYKNEHLINPCGMVILDDGSILVCSNRNNSVFLISDDFKKGRVLLGKKDGLFYPWSLAMDKEQNKLYVGSGYSCNCLKVYSFD